MIRASVVIKGEAEGEVLRLSRPISFWGGVDPKTGRLTDPRHPQHEQGVAGRIVVVERLIGSSSGSSVLLEMVAAGVGPAALILGQVDAIAALGALVAQELGLKAPPMLELGVDLHPDIPSRCRIFEDGTIADAGETDLHRRLRPR